MSKKLPVVSVQVRKGDINRALKIFKRRSMDSGHLMELRERRYYKKPTTLRRREKQLAVREQQKLTILDKQGNGDTKAKLYTKKPKKQRNIDKKDKKNDKRR
jgi:small subunit ribosomal protein S21|tara:strand:- start:72 stop:377 length:306 start_codon:yes stop_codon:yes gene_type:complete